MPKGSKVKVATCQLGVGGDIGANASRIRAQIDEAARLKADVAHFPECALSGYAGTDFKSWDDFDWDLLTKEMKAICKHVLKRKIWVVLGSTHRLSGGNLPHNSLYLITPDGAIADRYDKRFCTNVDLKYYTPGNHFGVFEINRVRCGMLICYDARFPELYRQYKRRDVEVMFHSFYNARADRAGILSEIMPATIRTRAASNYMWVSASNACGHYQEWASFVSQPDGIVASRLRLHRPGVKLTAIDATERFYDAAGAYRNRAIRGLTNSAPSVRDKRSGDRENF